MIINLLVSNGNIGANINVNETLGHCYILKPTGSGTFTRTGWSSFPVDSTSIISFLGESGKSFSATVSMTSSVLKNFHYLMGTSVVSSGGGALTVGEMEADVTHRVLIINGLGSGDLGNTDVKIRYHNVGSYTDLPLQVTGKNTILTRTAPQKFTVINNHSSKSIHIAFWNYSIFTKDYNDLGKNIRIPKSFELGI